MKEGPLAGQRVPVETELVVGRVAADVTLEDPLISRRHAAIRPVGDTLEIEDLGSLNGTWVNGVRIEGSRGLERATVGSGKTLIAPLAPSPIAGAVFGEDELRPVTAVFADIVGSTTLGE